MNLIILTSDPYSSLRFSEGIDLVFAMAAFEQDLQLVIKGPALASLNQHQDPEAIELRSIEKKLASLPVYGVEDIFYVSDQYIANGVEASQIKEPELIDMISKANNVQVF